LLINRCCIQYSAVVLSVLFILGGISACAAVKMPMGSHLICEMQDGEQRLQYRERDSVKVSVLPHEMGSTHVQELWFSGKHGRVQINVPYAQYFSYPGCRLSRIVGDTVYVYPLGLSVRTNTANGMLVSTDAGRQFSQVAFPGLAALPVFVEGSHVLNANWSVVAADFVSANEVVLIQSATLCEQCTIDAAVRRVESHDAGKTWAVTDYAMLESEALPTTARIIEHAVELRYTDKTNANLVREAKNAAAPARRTVDEFWRRAPQHARDIDYAIPGGGSIVVLSDEPWINEAGKVVGLKVNTRIHFGDKVDMALGVAVRQISGSQQLTRLRLYDCMLQQPNGVMLHDGLHCRDLYGGINPRWPVFHTNADYEFTFLFTPSNCFSRQYEEAVGRSELDHPFGPADYGSNSAVRYRFDLTFLSGFAALEIKHIPLMQSYRPKTFFESIETDSNIQCY